MTTHRHHQCVTSGVRGQGTDEEDPYVHTWFENRLGHGSSKEGS